MRVHHKAEITDLEARLHEFEEAHQMTSAEFYRRFTAGTLDDGVDFFEWSATFQIWRAMMDDSDASYEP